MRRLTTMQSVESGLGFSGCCPIFWTRCCSYFQHHLSDSWVLL